MFSGTAILLAGMPWGFLTPVFLVGVGLGIFMAKKSTKQKIKKS